MKSLRYDDFVLGYRVEGAITVTETHVVTSAGLFNDFNPMHVNDEFARRSLHGRRIVSAPTIIGFMLGMIGNEMVGTGIADLEMSFRFRHPVSLGETIRYAWEVTEREDKPKYKGGIITVNGTCHLYDETLILDAVNKLLISNEIPEGGLALT